MKIPGGDRAIVDAAKVRDYLLSPQHRVGSAKARFFAQFGFNQENWSVLRDQLRSPGSSEAETGPKTAFGQKYLVTSTIQGPAGRAATVVVVWIILNGEDVPRFVTAYPGVQR